MAPCPKERLRGVVGRSILQWDAEVEDPASVMSQHQEYAEHLEAESRSSEEVHGYQVLHMILQDPPPNQNDAFVYNRTDPIDGVRLFWF